MKKTISLCIIARDAQENLEECLNSVKGIVDEIVLVDTGSVDSTKLIAYNYNASVYDYQWNDSFADARNFALSKVTSDWILVLDSDETFVGKRENLEEIMNQDYQDKIPMYFLDIFTYTKDDVEYEYYQKRVRFFPNKNNIAYHYNIGEDVFHPEGNEKLQGLNAKGVAIKHFLKEGPKSKSRRNVLMLKSEIKKAPDSFYYNYLMGKECLLFGFYAKAFTSYQKALDSNDQKDDIYLSEICTDIIKILNKQGNREEALNECIRREKVCESNPEYWMTYGHLALKEGDLATAKKAFIKCLELDPPAHILTIKIENITWKPEMMLGYTYLRLKDYKNSRLYLEKALEHNDNNWLLLFYLGSACKNLRDFNASEAYFKAAELIVPDEYSQDLKFSMLLMHIMNGKFDKASDVVKSMVDDFNINNDEELSLVDYDIFD